MKIKRLGRDFTYRYVWFIGLLRVDATGNPTPSGSFRQRIQTTENIGLTDEERKQMGIKFKLNKRVAPINYKDDAERNYCGDVEIRRYNGRK